MSVSDELPGELRTLVDKLDDAVRVAFGDHPMIVPALAALLGQHVAVKSGSADVKRIDRGLSIIEAIMHRAAHAYAKKLYGRKQ